jgi:signal transduction histidine kinase
MSRDVEVLLYRVAQEAITNVTEHARATTMLVSLLEEDGEIVLDIADDGVGFDPDGVPDSAKVGLATMLERVAMVDGTLDIVGRAGGGTRVTARIPLEAVS